MDKDEMIKDKEQMARIIAFELCPYKYHQEWWGENAKCYSDSNFAHCPRVKEVVDKLYNAGYRKVGKNEVVVKKSKIGMLEKTIDYLEMEKAQLNKQLEKAKQETTREILQKIRQKYGRSCSEYYPEYIELTGWQLNNIATELGVELEDKNGQRRSDD